MVAIGGSSYTLSEWVADIEKRHIRLIQDKPAYHTALLASFGAALAMGVQERLRIPTPFVTGLEVFAAAEALTVLRKIHGTSKQASSIGNYAVDVYTAIRAQRDYPT